MSDTIPPPNFPTKTEVTEENLKLSYLLEDIKILYRKIREFHASSIQLIEDNAILRQENHNLKQERLKLERQVFTLKFNGGKEKLECGCGIDDIKCIHKSYPEPLLDTDGKVVKICSECSKTYVETEE